MRLQLSVRIAVPQPTLFTAILVIGIVGMVLDQALARATRAVTFPE